MAYIRVIPRDFFNESKLLKCLGRFQLLIHDRGCKGYNFKVIFHGEPFSIKQNDHDGSLFVENYCVMLDGERLDLFSHYNSKESYPLFCVYRGDLYRVLDDDGNFIFQKDE